MTVACRGEAHHAQVEPEAAVARQEQHEAVDLHARATINVPALSSQTCHSAALSNHASSNYGRSTSFQRVYNCPLPLTRMVRVQ
eukprot:701023-Pleurochrysis_carterae.AAC.1